MCRFLPSLLAIVASTATAVANDWTLLKYEGRDHVPLENVATFYGLDHITRASNDVTLNGGARSLRGHVGSNEFYINNLKFILSYPIAELAGQPIVSRMDLAKIIEPVLRPSRIKGAEKIDTIILDPGHGGYDNGATSPWGNEKNFALDVAFRARDLLLRQGFKVQMTRSSDVFVPLEDRARIANQHSNALFISIHFNSGGPTASGLETYTLAPRGVPSMAADGPRLSDLQMCAGNSRDSENMALATATHAALVGCSQLYDRGIKRARFVVIRDVTIPGVLIEGGFLSNASDSRRVATTAYRQQMATCITDAVQAYRNSVGPAPLIATHATEATHVSDSASATTTTHGRPDEPVVMIPTAN
ncbi:MAG: N-acetylmuramoyl-L-alanine amidase [Verrucomicrobiota bacterium]|nr:N-acetylmuramoyl-L-alanine amidase [Verrucomicrobiota bacterium]